jgi:hypothetical protein
MARKSGDPAASSPSVKTPDQAEGHQPERPYRPTERQCALLILYLVRAREEEFEKRGLKRNMSRARISQNTIRKLCGRSQMSPDFLLEVQEYLLAAGWALFCIGPTHYAIIKLESVLGWSRISSNRIAEELKLVPRGNFPWKKYDHLLSPNDDANVDDQEDEREGEAES